jgi:hypothetical protein
VLGFALRHPVADTHRFAVVCKLDAKVLARLLVFGAGDRRSLE